MKNVFPRKYLSRSFPRKIFVSNFFCEKWKKYFKQYLQKKIGENCLATNILEKNFPEKFYAGKFYWKFLGKFPRKFSWEKIPGNF